MAYLLAIALFVWIKKEYYGKAKAYAKSLGKQAIIANLHDQMPHLSQLRNLPILDVYLKASMPLALHNFSPFVNAVDTSSTPVDWHANMTVLRLLVLIHMVHLLLKKIVLQDSMLQQVLYYYTTMIAINVNPLYDMWHTHTST